MTVFAHLPIYGLEDLGLVPRGEAGRFIAERNIAPAASCRSTPTAAASPTCIPACTACTRCRRACAPPKSLTPRSRSATASAACSPPPAPSSCRTSRRKTQNRGGTWVPPSSILSGITEPLSRRPFDRGWQAIWAKLDQTPTFRCSVDPLRSGHAVRPLFDFNSETP